MAYTLQILHASDLEGGVDAITRAPNFAALVDVLEDTYENSITLSAGDNYIAGPFFNAALFMDEAVFSDTYNTLFDLPADVDGDGTEDAYAAIGAGRGHVDIAVMNAIGFDASALGNHEFDLGTGQIADLLTPVYEEAGLADDEWIGTQFPYLSANLDFSGDSSLADLATTDILTTSDMVLGTAESSADSTTPRIAPAVILEENGEQIGVVGATTPLLETISSPGSTELVGPTSNDMQALADVLQPVIDDLLAQGVNKIILTTHLQQISLEKELIGLLSGVDVVIAGGSDTLQADETDTLHDGHEADETYPYVTTNADGDPAIIVSTDGEYSYVGRLVVEFDDAGVVNPDALDSSVNGAYATTDAVVAEVAGDIDVFAEGTKGAMVTDLVSGVSDVVTAQDGNTFGSTDVYLEGSRGQVRTQETNLGNLTADANLATAQSVDDSVVVSIKNGGGIRAAIGEIGGAEEDYAELPPQANASAGKEEGEVSQLDITNALRFNNELTLVTLSPEQLLEVLEHGVAESGDGNTPGQFPQVGGLTFSFDVTQDAGSRVESVSLLNEDGTAGQAIVEDGAVVADAPETIRVVTLSFLADGGDGYPFADFVAADPTFADRLDLAGEEDEDLNLNGTIDAAVEMDAGVATFADAGTEQDALAEYLAANFADSPFDSADTDVTGDTRIVQLAEIDDADADTDGDGNVDGDDDGGVDGDDGADDGADAGDAVGHVINVQRDLVGANGGDDIYVLAQALVDDGAEISISDSTGDNTIQMIDGLTITGMQAAANTMRLTLSNDAEITVLGASEFTYELGGSPLTGEAGTPVTYEGLLTDVFAIDAVPTGNDTATSDVGEVVIGLSEGTTAAGSLDIA